MHLIKDENGNLVQHGHEHTPEHSHEHTHADGVTHTHAHTHSRHLVGKKSNRRHEEVSFLSFWKLGAL